jgi:Xaa-Pro aminopeptidase
MAKVPSSSILLYSDTARSADALYFGGVQVPDAFIAMGVRGERIAVVSALEFGRVKRESLFDTVLPLEDCSVRAAKVFPRLKPGPSRIIALLAKEYRTGTLAVPREFHAGLYADLLKAGVKVTVAEGMLFPQREIKTSSEAEKLREGNRCSAAGIGAAERVLEQSKVKGGRLIYRGRTLTSEILKVAIETACIEAGSVSDSTIAAGGDQACDPHHRGSGPLRPHELIIVDVFPRVVATGFYGDMTRTFLKGRPSEAQRALVAAVQKAQKAAMAQIRAGVPATEPHRAVEQTFATLGYQTKRTAKGSVGFFHGTGHGLGMEVHEPPRMNAVSHEPLKLGTVVTVEPGLYYPGLGGCRVEDVAQVTRSTPRMLSQFHYRWHIR